MNLSEKIALKILNEISAEIIYEPNGTTSIPDFLVNSDIAVEVRRLNQNYSINRSSYEGEEKQGLKVFEALTTFFRGLDKSGLKRAYLVEYSFQRPIPKFKKLRKRFELVLNKVRKNEIPLDNIFKFDNNFFIEVYPTRGKNPKFELFSYEDRDHGSFWHPKSLIENLEILMKEKERKAINSKNSYKRWWLMLENHIASLDTEDEEYLKENFKVAGIWEKIIIFDPIPPYKKTILTHENYK